jgi:hypothetical protein
MYCTQQTILTHVWCSCSSCKSSFSSSHGLSTLNHKESAVLGVKLGNRGTGILYCTLYHRSLIILYYNNCMICDNNWSVILTSRSALFAFFVISQTHTTDYTMTACHGFISYRIWSHTRYVSNPHTATALENLIASMVILLREAGCGS